MLFSRSAVSQRDLQRVFKAIRFFWNHLLRRDLANKAKIANKEDTSEKSKLMLRCVRVAGIVRCFACHDVCSRLCRFLIWSAG